LYSSSSAHNVRATGHPVGVAHPRRRSLSAAARAQQIAQMRDALGHRTPHDADVAEVELGGQRQQAAEERVPA